MEVAARLICAARRLVVVTGAEISVASGLPMFVGTSYSVGITALALDAARMLSIPVTSIDPAGNAPPGAISIELNAEDALPRIVQECH